MRIKSELIRIYMWENKLTKKALCQKAGIGICALNKMLKNQLTFRFTQLVTLAHYMEKKGSDLIED